MSSITIIFNSSCRMETQKFPGIHIRMSIFKAFVISKYVGIKGEVPISKIPMFKSYFAPQSYCTKNLIRFYRTSLKK